MKSLEFIGRYIIVGLSILILMVLSLSGLLQRVAISFYTSESSYILNNSLTYITALIIGFFGVWGSRLFLKKVTSRQLFWGLAILYVLSSAYLVYFGHTRIRGDAGMVFTIAQDFLKGDFTSQTDYLDMYPFQLGLVLYDKILLSIYNLPMILYATNALLTLGINFLLWQMMKKHYGEVLAVKYTVLLSFLFLPQFFFILFAYGLIPGLFFMVLSVYFLTRYFDTRHGYFMVLNIVFIMISGVLKNNYFIAGIAMAIVYLLDLLREKRWINIIAMIAILFAFAFPQKVLNHYYYEKTGIELRGMPKVLHIAMGLQDKSTTPRPGGWYNGYNADIYNKYKDQKNGIEKMSTVAKSNIDLNLRQYFTHPRKAYEFFEVKFKTTWLNPLFQSVWSGPLESEKQYTQTRLLQSIYNGGRLWKWVYRLSNVIIITIFNGSLLMLIYFLWKNKPFSSLEMFSMLYLLGGTIFHLIWETKSQYVYPYVFMLIPLASLALSLILKKKDR